MYEVYEIRENGHVCERLFEIDEAGWKGFVKGVERLFKQFVAQGTNFVLVHGVWSIQVYDDIKCEWVWGYQAAVKTK